MDLISELRRKDPLLPLIVAFPGSVQRSALLATLASDKGSQILGYLTKQSTCGEAVHWLDTVQASDADEDAARTDGVALRPLTDEDLPALFMRAFDPECASTWRFRGRTAPFSAFYEDLHLGVLAQFAVVGNHDSHLYGVVTAYQANLDQGHCYVAFLRCSVRKSHGEMSHGMVMLLDHLFRSFALRKVYIEVPGFNMDKLGLPATVFITEGILSEYDFYDGRYWDRVIAATTRDRWEMFAAPLRSWIYGHR